MAILKGLGIFFLSRPIFYSLGTQIFFNCSKWLSRGSRGDSGHHAVGLITIAKLTALPKNSDSRPPDYVYRPLVPCQWRELGRDSRLATQAL